MDYRHEWKFEIDRADMLTLRMRLCAVLQKDPHAVGDGYRIRSLYFDTPADTALREKRDGVNEREKFRIRLYNDDPGMIRLEKKSKKNALGSKETALLTEEETHLLLAGETEWMHLHPAPLVRELYVKMRTQGLRPKTLVEYTREPFVYPPGNVRVTLDYDLRTGLRCTDLLNPDCVTVPAGDAPALMEVKWDEYLPDVVRAAVTLPARRAGAFSKYAQCRIYD